MGKEKESNAYVLLGEIAAYTKHLPEEERDEFQRKCTALYRTLVKVCESLRAVMIPDPAQCKVTHCPFCPPECDFKNNPLGPIEAK